MESKSLLEEIKSRVNIRHIFSFIEEKKKYKIVVHSNKLQKILNLDLQSYKEKYFESLSYINFSNCVTSKVDLNSSICPNEINISDLECNYNNELEKIKDKKNMPNKIIDEFIVYYFKTIYNRYKSKEEVNKIILGNHLLIDIYSPIYEKLKKEDFFEKLFILHIPIPLIYDKDFINNNFLDFIQLLNEAKQNMHSFYLEIDEDTLDKNINDFKEFCTGFKRIKKLVVDNHFFFSKPLDIFEFIPFKCLKYNLIYLEVKFDSYIKLSTTFSNKINELKVLEELRLDHVNSFFLAKTNLKYLSLSRIGKLTIAPNCFSNMETMNLFSIESLKIKQGKFFANENLQKIKLPKLISFKVSRYHNDYHKIFDFESCQKLKYFMRLDSIAFLNLKDTLLEKVYIQDKFVNKSLIDEILMLKKLIEIKILKEIKIDISYINEENIKEIEGENPAVEKLIINLEKNHIHTYDYDLEQKKHILYGFQKKFPNLKEFQIYLNKEYYHSKESSKFIITQNPNCKINKFKFSGGNSGGITTIFYTVPFKNLIDVEFGCTGPCFNYEDSFPLFNENCNVIFESLVSFKFISNNALDLKIIKNVINNLEKMPNLKIFVFKGICEIDESTYIKMIEKLLLSNFKNIEFDLNKNDDTKGIMYYDTKKIRYEYSEKDLNNICKGINFKKFEKVKINKI